MRAAVAAVTTGTVAVSGVALAGCATTGSQPHNSGLDEASVTSPLHIGALSALSSSGTRTILPAQAVEQTVLRQKGTVTLAAKTSQLTVGANNSADVGFTLTDAANKPVAGQRIRVQTKLPAGWATFKSLVTDKSGYAHYTAHVLTTTNLTAVFDGSDSLRAAHAGVTTVSVPAYTAPVVVTRAAFTSAVANTPAGGTAIAAAAPAANSSLGERIVYLASLQAGKPYVYGAEGPNAFDCSGLVQYVFQQLNRSVPRTAEAQYEASTKISQYNKQVGDLIFFGTPGNIYHVAIYAGNGMIWDAPNSGQVVQLQSIWTTSYSVGRYY